VLGGIAGLFAIVLFVMAHEAGHFFAAKATGMKATEFFFGFGPRLWSVRRGETEYGFKLVPFGGYVRILGMSPFEEVPPEDVGRTYREKPFWKKSVVVLSGVAMNFFIAFAIFFGLVTFEGVPEPTTAIAVVVPEVDGVATAAANAELQAGDVIVSVDGVPTPSWEQVSSELATRPGEQIVVGIDRDGETLEVAVDMGIRVGDDDVERGFLGVSPGFESRRAGVFEAFGIAGEQVWSTTRFAVEILGNLVRPDSLLTLAGGLVGNEVPNEIRPVSPIGIVNVGSQVERLGIANFIALLASVNIILGTLNVLPLYPLDGGHFAVALYEKVTGRSVDFRKLAPIAAMVVGLILFLGIVAIVLDIVDPIRL
jgi:membrane-associated protease RseP (regulator of RpoE activity)